MRTEWLDSGLLAHVIARWLGNMFQIQHESYAQLDDHHFDSSMSSHQNWAGLCLQRRAERTELTNANQRQA